MTLALGLGIAAVCVGVLVVVVSAFMKDWSLTLSGFVTLVLGSIGLAAESQQQSTGFTEMMAAAGAVYGLVKLALALYDKARPKKTGK